MSVLHLKGPATIEQIDEARRTHHDPHAQERLLAVRMAHQGRFRVSDIALALGRSERCIRHWLKKYRRGGLEALLRRSNGHRHPSVDENVQASLVEKLKQGCWKTAKDIKAWLLKEHDIKLSLSGVYYWLRKLGASLKWPRKRHHKQDPQEVQQFKQQAVNRLLALPIPRDKRVRIWIQDEHRYGLISSVRRCWTLRGHRPTAPVQMKYQWGYVYGAAEVLSGETQFWYTPSVSTDYSAAFLDYLHQTDPQAYHVVFWDQAGFHPKPDDPCIPENLFLIPLPAYSPELNPMEQVWDPVKRHVSNAVWATLKEMESAITEVLRRYWEDARIVWSLLGDRWLTRAVSTFMDLRQAEILN